LKDIVSAQPLILSFTSFILLLLGSHYQRKGGAAVTACPQAAVLDGDWNILASGTQMFTWTQPKLCNHHILRKGVDQFIKVILEKTHSPVMVMGTPHKEGINAGSASDACP
jgi:hypothetical protein